MSLVSRLWSEDAGFIISTEAIIILTMLICAAVVGWQAVRIAVLTELADIAEAIAALDQSYSFAGFTGHAATCSGSIFTDERDFCDDADCVGEAGGLGRCITLVGAVKEDGAAVSGSGDSGA
jgi:hypothetical protein